MKSVTVGQRVLCNGFVGYVMKVCDGVLTGMAEVQVARGLACVSIASLEKAAS